MRQYLIPAVSMLAFAFSADAAPRNPSGYFFKPYVGADYEFIKYGNETFAGNRETDDFIDTGLHGANAHVGARIHRNWGMELGYSQTEEGEKNTTGAGLTTLGGTPINNTKTDVETVALDVMGYFPVTRSLEFIGSAGVSYSKISISSDVGTKTGDSEWQPRVGLGGQYWFNDNVNFRSLVRYTKAEFSDRDTNGSVDGAYTITAGVNYQF